MSERVALVRCPDYALQRVDAAVRRAVDLLGGIEAFVSAGQRVLLKPNLVRALPPERAVCTHPAMVAAVARLVNEAGAHPLIAESPGGPYTPGALRTLYERTGMRWAAEVGGAELNYDVAAIEVSYPDGAMLKRLELIAPFAEADALINLAKLKTHNLTTLTAAVKNLFGLVPGALKIGYHAKLRDARRFCEGLVDVACYARPTLNLVDAVVAMEGNGPSGGDPRPLGALLAGSDPYAVDVLCAGLTGLVPERVPTTAVAMARGLTSGRIEDLAVVGDPLEALRCSDFRLGLAVGVDPGLLPKALLRVLAPRTAGGPEAPRTPFQALSTGWFARQLVALPSAGPACTACGYCARHCPVNAITIGDGRARMDPAVCIRCYCCHELCPETAVELSRPWLGRLLMGR